MSNEQSAAKGFVEGGAIRQEAPSTSTGRGRGPRRGVRLKLQPEQANLQGQRFLNVRGEQPLRGLESLQILHRLLRRKTTRHSRGGLGQVGESEHLPANLERLQP